MGIISQYDDTELRLVRTDACDQRLPPSKRLGETDEDSAAAAAVARGPSSLGGVLHLRGGLLGAAAAAALEALVDLDAVLVLLEDL